MDSLVSVANLPTGLEQQIAILKVDQCRLIQEMDDLESRIHRLESRIQNMMRKMKPRYHIGCDSDCNDYYTSDSD